MTLHCLVQVGVPGAQAQPGRQRQDFKRPLPASVSNGHSSLNIPKTSSHHHPNYKPFLITADHQLFFPHCFFIRKEKNHIFIQQVRHGNITTKILPECKVQKIWLISQCFNYPEVGPSNQKFII